MVIIQTLSTFYLTHSIPDSHEFSFERRQKVLSEKKERFPSWELIFLLQKFHSVELKKKRLKYYRETKYYVKPLCCLNLMMKQTIFLVIRANISEQK